jgi:hypothetical protein
MSTYFLFRSTRVCGTVISTRPAGTAALMGAVVLVATFRVVAFLRAMMQWNSRSEALCLESEAVRIQVVYRAKDCYGRRSLFEALPVQCG